MNLLLQRAKAFGQIAQLVEQRTENPRVGGSTPSLATIISSVKGDRPRSPFSLPDKPLQSIRVTPRDQCDRQSDEKYVNDKAHDEPVPREWSLPDGGERNDQIGHREGNPRPVTRARYDWQIYDPNRKEKGGVRWHTVEGPAVIKRKGLYYEMFSGGNWQNTS